MWIAQLKKTPLAREEMDALARAFDADVKFSGDIAFLDKSIPFWRLTQSAWVAREFPATRKLKEFRVTGPHGLELWLGAQLNGTVNLSKPKTVVRVALVNGKAVFGIEEWKFEQKKIAKPAVTYPGMMKPETARLLVNLAGVKPREKFLDPFCGTGMIPIEASLAGAKSAGIDVLNHMIDASKKNSKNAGAKVSLLCDNFFYAPLQKADVVVTDLPYGRAAKRVGRGIEERAVARIAQCLKRNGRAVIISNKKLRSNSKLKLKKVLKQRVHTSLTRKIHFFTKE